VFTVAQARAAGVGPQRLKAPDLCRLSHGLYARTDADLTVVDLARAHCGPSGEAVACGPTAAELLGMPLPYRLRAHETGRIDVTAETRHRDSAYVRWHQLGALGAQEVLEVQGIRATTRVRTWADLSAVLTVDELTMVTDHLIRWPRFRFEGRRRPYADLGDLRVVAEGRPGRRGTTTLRAALGQARVGSDSPAETMLRLHLLRAGLPAPQLNRAIAEGGVGLGEPDLSWPEFRVCVEHEGPSHLTRDQQERDIARTEARTRHGWIEVRTVAADLRDHGARAVSRIVDALRRQGWTG
jgi:very-short-patch-repair endonuclease